MDYENMTAPCGIPCFECLAYKAKSNETLNLVASKIISERSISYLEEFKNDK
jgi:hypothetical protein